MRFLIGLVVGAGLVLTVAPAEDLADNPLTARALTWSRAALSTLSGALASAPAAEPASAPAPRDQVPQEAAVAPAAPADAANVDAADPAAQPIVRVPDPPFDGSALAADSRVAEPPGAVPAAPAVIAVTEETYAPALASAAVWEPFRSEMSAVGFADRLSRSLDHPFLVERRGPGRYQVVFGYRDEAERRTLLDDAAAVTGLPL